MKFHQKVTGRRSITTLVVFGLVFLLTVALASAYCGPEFNNKQQAISFIKSEPAVAAALAKHLSSHKQYGYSADNDVIGALEQNAKAFKAPPNYKLTYNTACGAGPGHYEKYDGLLNNMGGRLMLWYGNKKGEYFPLLKGYCFNAVFGPPVIKRPPTKSPPCKKKCKPPCKKKCKKPKKKACTTKAGHANGNCVKQTNTATVEQECKGVVSGNQCISTITQINNVCGNVNTGDGTVNQGGNCNTGGEEVCVGQNNCNTENPPCTSCPPPPCNCPAPEKIMITAYTELNMIPAGKTSGPFKINVNASKAGGTLTVDPGRGGVSSCNSSTPEVSITTSVPSGASEQCVIIYAPEDADKPASITITMTVNLGSASEQKTQTVPITYPTRPE